MGVFNHRKIWFPQLPQAPTSERQLAAIFRPYQPMKTLVRIASFCIALFAGSLALEAATPAMPPESIPQPPPPPPEPSASQPSQWSLVYLPDLDWSAPEIEQAVALIQQLKPELIVSLSPCPFAARLKALAGKPTLLDQSSRHQNGGAAGLPNSPFAAYSDTSTRHEFGTPADARPNLVWLAAEANKKLVNGPRANSTELRALAKQQIRKHLGELSGEVIFLVDPSIPTPPEQSWQLPMQKAYFAQAATAVGCFTCLRPGALQAEIPALDGIAPRLPILHWLHHAAAGMTWEVLPIDGGPAIHHSAPFNSAGPYQPYYSVARLRAPLPPPAVPRWMDDYVNANPALGVGHSRLPERADRLYHWTEADGPRTPDFPNLRTPAPSAAEGTQEVGKLPHDAVRSPSSDLALLPDQVDERGWHPKDGDDGVQISIADLRVNQSRRLYYAGMHSAWPAAATWFTDRFVLTSGYGCTCDPIVSARNEWDADDESSDYLTPQLHSQTIRLFDLLTGSSFATISLAESSDRGQRAFTERIFFPARANTDGGAKWPSLWKAIEAGYHARPEPAPFKPDAVVNLTKQPPVADLQWKDLGIWPPPETWRLAPENDEPAPAYEAPKPVATSDPYLTYTPAWGGGGSYSLAISGFDDDSWFEEQETPVNVVAHAEILTTGGGGLPRLATIRRTGEHQRYLVLAGDYQIPNGAADQKRQWLLLVDLLKHRAWTLNWEANKPEPSAIHHPPD